jgi:protein CpxP
MNIKSKNKWAIVGILALILVIPPVVQAGFGGKHRGMGRGMMGMETLLELNLTDQQRAELKEIIAASRSEQEKYRERMREARKNMREVLRAEQFDETALREAFRKSSSVREDLFVLRMKMRDDMRKVLTDEQRAMLEEKRKQRREEIKARVRTRLQETDQ